MNRYSGLLWLLPPAIAAIPLLDIVGPTAGEVEVSAPLDAHFEIGGSVGGKWTAASVDKTYRTKRTFHHCYIESKQTIDLNIRIRTFSPLFGFQRSYRDETLTFPGEHKIVF